MKAPKKIVTHAGTFHADEVSAVALLLYLFPGTPVERTYTPSEEDFADPGVWIVDIGRRYAPKLNNYDHHHDAGLPASNVLILLACKEIIKHSGQYNYLLANLFHYINLVDVGTVIEKAIAPEVPYPDIVGIDGQFNGVPTISSIIRACNNLPEETGWQMALTLMSNVLQAYIATNTVYRATQTRWGWEVTKRFGFKLAIFDSEDYLVGWEGFAETEGINYLINRNKRGGYQITSRDSRQYPIPAHSSQTFLHNSGFIASYPTLEAAIAHAEQL